MSVMHRISPQHRRRSALARPIFVGTTRPKASWNWAAGSGDSAVTDLKISRHSSMATCAIAECVGSNMSDTAYERGTSAVDAASAPEPLVHRIWPWAIVGVSLAIGVAWICILAYGFVRLVALLV